MSSSFCVGACVCVSRVRLGFGEGVIENDFTDLRRFWLV